MSHYDSVPYPEARLHRLRPEDGMVNVASSVKLQSRLQSNLCSYIS